MFPMMFCRFPMSSLPTLHKYAKGEALHPHIETVILGEPPKFSFIFGDGPIKMAHCKKQKQNKT